MTNFAVSRPIDRATSKRWKRPRQPIKAFRLPSNVLIMTRRSSLHSRYQREIRRFMNWPRKPYYHRFCAIKKSHKSREPRSKRHYWCPSSRLPKLSISPASTRSDIPLKSPRSTPRPFIPSNPSFRLSPWSSHLALKYRSIKWTRNSPCKRNRLLWNAKEAWKSSQISWEISLATAPWIKTTNKSFFNQTGWSSQCALNNYRFRRPNSDRRPPHQMKTRILIRCRSICHMYYWRTST